MACLNENLVTVGIETSCDETSIAIVRGKSEVLTSQVASQVDLHTKYGGVVPEVACREHLATIGPLFDTALKSAGISADEIDLVAVTRGPGLIGALLVGLSFAKAFAMAKNLPLVGVNHLVGHICAVYAENKNVEFPAIALLVSGGHTELFEVHDHIAMKHIGGTVDDAVGEAFDKVARMLGLGYPGGPQIEKEAEKGTPDFYVPVAMKNSGTLDFSFSGPKTAMRNIIEKEKDPALADLCASFQTAAIEALYIKTKLAIKQGNYRSIIVAGGVACNGALREKMYELGGELGMPVYIPSVKYCSDNAAMIAIAGALEYTKSEDKSAYDNYLDLDAVARWIP